MERPWQITNEEEWLQDCNKVVSTAGCIIDGSIGITAGARLLADLRFRVRAEHDPDFLVFAGIHSETDRFPLGEVRKLWSAEVLAHYDDERLAAEARWSEVAEKASRHLIQKYGHKKSRADGD
jgi:hypothetical protein